MRLQSGGEMNFGPSGRVLTGGITDAFACQQSGVRLIGLCALHDVVEAQLMGRCTMARPIQRRGSGQKSTCML